MSLSVDVYLLSGKCASFEVESDASVESLKCRAQNALVVPRRGQLRKSSGEVLDGTKTIAEAKLMSGDVLTLHVNQLQLQATRQRVFSLHSPHSWVMDLWSLGVTQPVVATVVQSRRS